MIASTAGIAQLVEQLLRKQLVGGSSPLSGTNSKETQLSGLMIYIEFIHILHQNTKLYV